MVFSENTAVKVFTLYQYCRYVDDCGDELEPTEGKKRLSDLIGIIDGNKNGPEDITLLVHSIIQSGVSPVDLKVLISGAMFEAEGKSVQSKQDLIHYCYLVAGVVGKMMCPLIGVTDKSAYPYAIDLGIAMQLTNICRDIFEDHKMNRYYLWELKVENDSLNTSNNKDIVLKNLELADLYYRSAFTGLSYIPFRSRVAIFVASEVYRAIGKKIKRTDDRVFSERIYLNSFEKFWVCFKSSFKILHPSFWRSKTHKSTLHTELNKSLELMTEV